MWYRTERSTGRKAVCLPALLFTSQSERLLRSLVFVMIFVCLFVCQFVKRMLNRDHSCPRGNVSRIVPSHSPGGSTNSGRGVAALLNK